MATPSSGKSAAAAAAKTLLAERIALVEALGAAVDAHQHALTAVTTAQTAAAEAARQVQAAFDAAKAGGWSASELHHVGLRAPATPRKRHKTTTQPGPTDATDTPVNTKNGSNAPTAA